MSAILHRLRAMDADQLAAWVCLHPQPSGAEREALAGLIQELPYAGRPVPMEAM